MVQVLATWSYGIAAVAFVAFAIQLGLGWRGSARGSIVLIAVMLSACWAGFAFGYAATDSPTFLWSSNLFDTLRMAAWLVLLLSLLYLPEATAPIDRRALAALARNKVAAAIGLLVLAALVVQAAAVRGLGAAGYGQVQFGTSLVLAIAGLFLVEQLFRNIPAHVRWGVKPLCLGLAGAFAFDVYLFADAFLFKHMDIDIWIARGLGDALIIPFIAVAVARNRDWTLDISVSRRLVFHSTSLLVSGGYLLAIATAGYYLRYFGGSWGRALQTVFMFAALMFLVVLVFSGSARSRLKVFLNKHFFSYRYDYREEWLRFTQSLAAQDPQLNIRQLMIKALADLVESPGGALWLRDAGGRMVAADRLNIPEIGDGEPDDSAFVEFLARTGWVVNVEDYKAASDEPAGFELPQWIAAMPNAWLLVPLLTLDELIGFVILVEPRARLEVNWEVLDLLKTAGRQAASFLGQIRAAEALLETRKFDAFNRMSAFVVHDVKNLVAQLSLLLKNAERHRDNPEFQDDMLATIDHVVERMKRLLLQLRVGAQPVDQPRPVDLGVVVARIQKSKAAQKPQIAVDAAAGIVALCHEERIERVIGHLAQNALEATPEAGRVWIKLGISGNMATVEVGDTGQGMSEEFVRERLFKPFQTTKEAGMGIGAYESQQYVSELGGEIVVDSRPDVGTRIRLLLPLYAGMVRAVEDKREVA